MNDINVLTSNIREWAIARNLNTADPTKQAIKLGEEFGELCSGLARGNNALVEGSLGDMYVVMTILAEQMGLDIGRCISAAYDEIKDRKGRMVDGVFVKESDLTPDLPLTRAICGPTAEEAAADALREAFWATASTRDYIEMEEPSGIGEYVIIWEGLFAQDIGDLADYCANISEAKKFSSFHEALSYRLEGERVAELDDVGGYIIIEEDE